MCGLCCCCRTSARCRSLVWGRGASCSWAPAVPSSWDSSVRPFIRNSCVTGCLSNVHLFALLQAAGQHRVQADVPFLSTAGLASTQRLASKLRFFTGARSMTVVHQLLLLLQGSLAACSPRCRTPWCQACSASCSAASVQVGGRGKCGSDGARNT